MGNEPLESGSVKATDWLPPASPSPTQSLPSVGAETFFGFHIGHLGFLVPVNTYCEVLEQTQVNPLPNTQPWLSGLLNLRGNLVPAIDLHRLLDEAVADPKKRRLFTIDKGDKAVALWIDGLPEVHGIDPQAATSLPALPAVLERFVSRGYSHQGQVWLQIQYSAFFKALGGQIALK